MIPAVYRKHVFIHDCCSVCNLFHISSFVRPEEVTEIAPEVTPEVTPEDGSKLALSRAQVEAHVHLSALDKSILTACKDVPKTGRDLVDISGYATRTGNLKTALCEFVEQSVTRLRSSAARPFSIFSSYNLLFFHASRLFTRES